MCLGGSDPIFANSEQGKLQGQELEISEMMSLDSADPESAMIESVTTKENDSFRAGVEEKNALSQARPVWNLRPLFSRRVDVSKGRNRERNAQDS